ncbi:MAG: twin-arginine translocase TatA/TatE family subunit [Acidobacteriota bacterium]|nr:twin-arginine translocase TatA/TatE family subunit [Acidobacteriota bacterium]
MSVLILFAIESPMLWVLVLLVIVLLFGASKLPQLAKALGQSRRAFKEGQDEADEEARRERAKREAQQLNAPAQRGALADVDDEQLFEEARRRAARLRAEEEKK